MSALRKQVLEKNLHAQTNIVDQSLFRENKSVKKTNKQILEDSDRLVRQNSRLKGLYHIYKNENVKLKREITDLRVQISHLEEQKQNEQKERRHLFATF